MANSTRILIVLAAISVGLIAPVGAAQRPATEPNQVWKVDDSFSFPVSVADNFVIDAPALRHRHIYLLIDGSDFTESNIRSVFASLAGKFPKPRELWIYAYSDRSIVQETVSKANGPIMSRHFARSPEGSRASRNYSFTVYPRRSGYYRAEYCRSSDGREEMKYSPHPEQEYMIEIDLTNPGLIYSGKLNEDLVTAAESGDLVKVNQLLELGADANAKGMYDNSALTLAAWNGQLEIVRSLINKGAEIDTSNGFTPLMAAAGDGGKEIVQLLLKHGADVNARTGTDQDSLDDTVLMIAALHGHAQIVEQLLASGARISDRNRFGETALMQAAVAGFPEMIRLLAAKGADVNATDIDGKTALMLSRDDKSTVELLLSLGAEYKRRDRDGMTPLMLAVRHYQSAKIDALIAGGAGEESIDPAKAYIAAPSVKHADENDRIDRKEEGYRILTTIYLKMGLKKEAVETSRKAIEDCGDKPGLRARLGSTLLAVGDLGAAREQYRLLKEREANAKDKNSKRLYRSWADGLRGELNEHPK